MKSGNIVTFDDKETLIEHPEIDKKNKVTADDINQLKAACNYLNSIGGDNIPIGIVSMYFGEIAPENWLFLNGQAVSRETYSELFELYGTKYGSGDGTTTFNLPDYRGRVPVGLDNNDVDFAFIGKTSGEKSHVLTTNEIPSHGHKLPQNGSYAVSTDGSSASGIAFGPKRGNSALVSESIGDDQAHNNLQPYIVTNYIVKAKMYNFSLVGIF